ncbi:MAG: hypothetical protein ACI4PW_09730 [Alphaproteobacteria bacterium]|jgi:hypothetical protein
MSEQEAPEVLSSLFEALLAYQDTQEGLARVRSTAESLWGAAWRQKLPSALEDCPEDRKAKVKANIDRALTYERAASVWAEASRLLDPRRAVDVAQIKPRLPDMQKWLAIFGQPGKDLFAKVQQRVAEAEANPSGAMTVAGTNMFGLTADQLWNFDHFMRLKDYYDQTISRTSARCVHLGGLELSQYPYFGYILDLLDEILTFGGELLGNPVYRPIIQARYKGGEPALRKVLAEFKKEFEDNAPPEMLPDEDSIEEIKNQLGALAANEPEEEDIGPPPDGFVGADNVGGEPLPGTAAKRPAPRISGGPVPMGKMPQKAPQGKGPVKTVKMPMKRPAPG